MSTVNHSLKWVILDSIQKCKKLETFKKIHAHLITSGVVSNHLVVNRVVEFFAKGGNFADYACDFLSHCDWKVSSFPYNSLVSGYAICDRPKTAILVYRRIVKDGFLPDMFTFPAVLKSCAKFVGFGEGRQVHGVIVKMGFASCIYVENSLVHFYSVCGSFGDASRVFDEMLVRDVVSWTGVISGYVRAGFFDEAVGLFLRMDVEPNGATFVSALVACGRKGYLSVGKGIHGLVIKRAFGVGLEVNNVLMDMYVKCESLPDAKQVFDELAEKDIVSWTSIISGLVQSKCPKEALELFCDMQSSVIEPDGIILTSVLSACASLGALDYGRWVHEYIDRKAIKWDIQIGTAMLDMYAKCGCIEMATQIFNGMPHKNVLTWNALLNGFAMHGHGQKVLKLFEEMRRVGMKPNEVTFLAILTACCHCGLVNEGRQYFHWMKSQQYNLPPRLEHYGCMVDLLCRAGLLDEALELTKAMDMPPDVRIMGALLSACKANGNVELPQEMLDHLVEFDSHDSGVYVLLSNIHAINQRWADVTRIRRLMKEKGIKKPPGLSVIEVDGKAHEFIVGGTRHPQDKHIRLLLKFLSDQIFPEEHLEQPFLI
ncbi:unnamed protein product [Dovyalis caffra]|uniref:Chlororespiratory reduction 4 n=1 Tax=Dovyalis caffra TaxID=77055 RepID=A0AAV1RP24_9ROSI|nr:unnamed protein product [Dovyalis caffra]